MNLLVLISCLYIIFHCIYCLNKMDKDTNNGIYFYHVIFAMAAFALFVFICNGHKPTLAEMLFSVGMSVRYIFNRRGADYELSKK